MPLGAIEDVTTAEPFMPSSLMTLLSASVVLLVEKRHVQQRPLTRSPVGLWRLEPRTHEQICSGETCTRCE